MDEAAKPSTELPAAAPIAPSEPAKIAEPIPPAAAAPMSAKEKLRAFEDKTFGKDAPRISGGVERGIGSPYAVMTAQQKAHYAALEQLVAAEKGMAEASAVLAAAEAAHETALKAASAMEETA